MKRDPASVRFDRMRPIVKEPFTPDDDAIVATNPLERRISAPIPQFVLNFIGMLV